MKEMMKSAKVALALWLMVSLFGAGWGFAQIKIPKENIKAEIPEAVKIEIVKLYSTDSLQRGNGCLNLGKLGTKAAPAVPFLVAMLGDQASVRRTQILMPGMLISAEFELSVSLGALAGETLGNLGEPGFTALREALRDKNAAVRASAASGLGEAKDRRAVEPLIAALADKIPLVRARAATALGKIGDKQAIASLVAALQDKAAPVRGAVAAALGEFKENIIAPPLIERLIDKDGSVRAAAVASLGKLKTKETLPPLLSALQDKSPRVRAAAAIALGKLKNKQALEPLIAALKDKDQRVRRVAATALGDLKASRAVPPLIAALQDPKDSELVNNAALALKKITGADFGSELDKWQEWWEENQDKDSEQSLLPQRLGRLVLCGGRGQG